MRHILNAILMLAALCGLAVVPAFAQGGPLVVINQTLTEQFPQVVAYVSVIDPSGLAIPGLTEADFSIAEDGRPVAPFTVTPSRDEGIQVILAMDASGSMLSGSALRDARAAAAAFVSQMTDRDRAAVLVLRPVRTSSPISPTSARRWRPPSPASPPSRWPRPPYMKRPSKPPTT
jgi:hypothetical protein